MTKDIKSNFESAVNFFLRSMRSRNFVEADELLLKKYGDILHTRVTAWCFEQGVTVRLRNGKLGLASVYKKPTASIIIRKQKVYYAK